MQAWPWPLALGFLLVIVATRDDLLNSGPKEDGLEKVSAKEPTAATEGCKTYMLILSGIRALDVTQGRVVLHNSRRDQIVELERVRNQFKSSPRKVETHAQEILLLTKSVQVPTAERQGAEILVDDVQQTLCRRKPKRHIRRIGNFGIMGYFHLFTRVSRGIVRDSSNTVRTSSLT